MSKIDNLTEELKQAILDSHEYKEYKRCEAELAKVPDIKRIVDEFRNKNFLIQYNDDIVDIDGGIAWIGNQYLETRSMPVVQDFLSAEVCLCRMVQDICFSLVGMVDFDVNFLDL